MANCPPCNTTSSLITLQNFTSVYNDCGCGDLPCECNGAIIDARCVFYTGPNLNCSQIKTKDSLEDILIKVDQKLCTSLGDYSIYNKFCIDDGGAITTEKEFVEAISEYACTLRGDIDNFIGTTFEDYKTEVDDRFDDIENPAIDSCPELGIIDTDNYNTVLTKLSNKVCELFTSKTDISTVNWNQCYIVSPLPTTIAEGFGVVMDQICDLKTQLGAEGGILPTFNNVGSCLPAPLTAADSLVDTVNKLKTRVCQSPTFDINALTWTCITKPTTTTLDLQSAFQSVLTKLDNLSQNLPTFNEDFTVVVTDAGAPCLGKTISLASTSGFTDKFVGVDVSDTTPGYLADKLEAGDNITFDTVTTPGKLIINSLGGALADEKVKTRAADPSAGYLEDKIEGSTDSATGVTVTATTNTTTNKTKIATAIDVETFWDALLDTLESSSEIRDRFCALVTECLPDCIIPPNVTVIYSGSGSTTSTTTTTTTTV